jgi:hypothetical protein
MPTLTHLNTCKIAMFAADHNPPHFHIMAKDGSKALVAISTLKVIRGKASAAATKEALAWASENTALLAAKWKELNP